MTDFTRQNDNFYLKKMKKTYRIIGLFIHYRKFEPEILPFWHKNRNQRVHMVGLMGGGSYMGGLYVE